VIVGPADIIRQRDTKAGIKARRAKAKAELEQPDPDVKPLRKVWRDRGDGGGRP
jgi:hypothetical protein